MALDSNIKNQLNAYMEKLVNPIVIAASADGSPKSNEMMDLLTELASLSSKIRLVEEQDKRTPSFSIRRDVAGAAAVGIRFAGIPMGHEFTSLILALLQVGGHPLKLEAEKIAQIAAIEGEFHFETYISLSCHNCPDVVQALNLMAVINPNITNVMIDGGVFQQEVTDKKIMSVPTVMLNGEQFGIGRMELDEI
ncbi:MAG: alkyl hydroperoxide reductase subunit F, partial [Methylophilaceae bacterium]|nr:alkyl hydroperoxide reductase subunit F [Methylophilaceae bacterium]